MAGKSAKKIVVAEDEELLRELVHECLEAAGHSVTVCASGEEALRACAAERFDLLITDLALPGLRGQELAQEALARQPQLKVVFMSGFVEQPLSDPPAGAVFLRKPFTPLDLLGALARVFGEASAGGAGGAGPAGPCP
jgi:CheY-like chemotaxis protein